MDEDLKIGIFFEDGTGRAGVVEMNVSKENGVQIGNGETR